MVNRLVIRLSSHVWIKKRLQILFTLKKTKRWYMQMSLKINKSFTKKNDVFRMWFHVK